MWQGEKVPDEPDLFEAAEQRLKNQGFDPKKARRVLEFARRIPRRGWPVVALEKPAGRKSGPDSP